MRTTASWLVYLLLAIVLTWPLALHLSDRIVQGDEPAGTVALFNLWTLEWNADRLAHAFAGFWDAPIFYPVSYSFALSETQVLTGTVFALVRFVVRSDVLAFNVLSLVLLVANGMAGSVLGRCLGLRGTAAWLGGLLCVAPPQVVRELGVLQLTAIAPVLLSLAALCHFANRPEIRSGLLLGAAVAATFLTTGYFALFLSLFLLPGVVLWNGQISPRAVLAAGTALLCAAALTAPIFVPQFGVLRHYAHSPEEIARTSARPADYASAPPRTLDAMFGARPEPARAGFALFPGVGMLVLAICSLFQYVARGGPTQPTVPPRAPRRWWLFASIATIVSLLISLGGNLELSWWHPFAWMQRWYPGFGGLRNTYRLGLFVQIGLLMFAFAGLHQLWRGPLAKAAAIVVVAWTIAESAEFPTPLLNVPRDDIERAPWVRALHDMDPGPVLLVPLPPLENDLSLWEPATVAMLQSLRFEKPLLNGYSGHFPIEYGQIARAIDGFPDEPSLRLLAYHGARYVVIDRPWLIPERLRELDRRETWVRIAYADDQKAIYRVLPRLTPKAVEQRPPHWRRDSWGVSPHEQDR